jgi:NCAIR mutase (PurE)-related protein
LKTNEILQKLKSGEVSVTEAEQLLEQTAFERMKLRMVENLARLDVYRDRRAGIPEVILAEGKKPEWVARLLLEMVKERGRAMATRVDEECIRRIREVIPSEYDIRVYGEARIVTVSEPGFEVAGTGGKVGLIAAGTADISVAEETRVTAEQMGCEVHYAYDVGIAGPHRVLTPLGEMLSKGVDVIVVVAGMDAVLPITVKGLVDLPVIGLPTSVGYGIGAKGIAPLLTMLQSCSPGLGVVNIDNGFGAGALAALIANRVSRARAGELKPKKGGG